MIYFGHSVELSIQLKSYSGITLMQGMIVDSNAGILYFLGSIFPPFFGCVCVLMDVFFLLL